MRVEAAERLGYRRIRSPVPIKTVMEESDLDEAIELTVVIGKVQTKLIAHIVPNAPADILLGQDFLKQHSRGFHIMLEEFDIRDDHMDDGSESERETICCIITEVRRKLEDLLKKYKELILEEDELPKPERCYKKRTFSLGLPEEKRNKIYYRPQYPPHPQEIPEYRKLIEPLIVYRESNSPHNNPVMLVAKKTKGLDLSMPSADLSEEWQPHC